MMKTTILAGAALFAIAGTAVAQTAQPQRGERGADVTRQQVAERAAQRFARMDLNNDGQVTREEAGQAREQLRAQMAGRMFERLDANRDGSISRAEFDQARAQRAERLAQRGPRAGMRGHRMGMRGHGRRGGGEAGARMFGEQGFVTREQFVALALTRFDRADADRNGTVTVAERRQARQAMRAQHMEHRGQRD